MTVPADHFTALFRALVLRRVTIYLDRVPYTFRGVPFRKLYNWLKVELAARLQPATPWGYPTHLQVEPSSLCSLRCAFCPVTTGLQRPTGLLKPETLRQVLDEIGEYLFLITLWDWGEPFLNPEIFAMIEEIKKRDIKVVSSTNGHHFADRASAEQLVLSGLDGIIFAVDGITEESYRTYRNKGSLASVITSLQQVVAAKASLGRREPLVHLRFIAMRHNEHEIPRLYDFARNLGVDILSVKTMNPHDQGECRSEKADGASFMPIEEQYQRFTYDSNGARIRRRKNPCKRLWNNPTLRWDGTLVACCFDPHNRYPLGNLSTSTFTQIWRGEAMRRFRQQFRENYGALPLCAQCSYAFVGGSCARETIADIHFFKDFK